MIQGTTPNVRFRIKNLDTNLITAAEIYFGQNGNMIIKKDNADCIIKDGYVSCQLTQSDTLCLCEKSRVDIQLRVEIEGGEVLATKQFKRYVWEIIDKEELRK